MFGCGNCLLTGVDGLLSVRERGGVGGDVVKSTVNPDAACSLYDDDSDVGA